MIAIMSNWRSIFEDAPVRSYAAGATLFTRGAPVFHVLLLRSGSVALERHLPCGDPLVLHVADPNDLLADASLFSETYHCDAVARTDAVVASISKAEVARFV